MKRIAVLATMMAALLLAFKSGEGPLETPPRPRLSTPPGSGHPTRPRLPADRTATW
jgi:hypothetical protein